MLFNWFLQCPSIVLNSLAYIWHVSSLYPRLQSSLLFCRLLHCHFLCSPLLVHSFQGLWAGPVEVSLPTILKSLSNEIWVLFYSDLILWNDVFIPPSPFWPSTPPSPPPHQSEATKQILQPILDLSTTTTREGGDVEIVVIVYCSIAIGIYPILLNKCTNIN